MSYSSDNTRENSGRKKMHYSPNLLSCLTNSIENTLLSELEYESRDNEVTKRTIEPMAVIYKNRKRHLIGWCQLRNDWRSFRLDRIEMIKVTNTEFQPREDFNQSDFEGDDEVFTQQNEEQKEN